MNCNIVDTDKLEKERAKEILKRNIEEIVGTVVLLAIVVVSFLCVCAFTDYNWVTIR